MSRFLSFCVEYGSESGGVGAARGDGSRAPTCTVPTASLTRAVGTHRVAMVHLVGPSTVLAPVPGCSYVCVLVLCGSHQRLAAR